MTMVIDCLFATIFFISFIGKIKNMKDSILMVQSYGVVPFGLLKASTYLLVLFELLLAILFAAGVVREVRDVMTILLLIFFISVILIKRRSREDSNTCSCIGEVEFINKYPVTRNIILMLMLLADLIFFSSHPLQHEHAAWIVIMISVLLALLSEISAKYKFVKGYLKNHVVS